jgi:hypothetical protein
MKNFPFLRNCIFLKTELFQESQLFLETQLFPENRPSPKIRLFLENNLFPKYFQSNKSASRRQRQCTKDGSRDTLGSEIHQPRHDSNDLEVLGLQDGQGHPVIDQRNKVLGTL